MNLPDLHLHDRAFPGPLGFSAFIAVKFAGYVLAGFVLKRIYPSISSGAAKIAAVKTGFGILLGPLFFIGVVALSAYMHWTPNSNLEPYLLLLSVRVLVWALVIWIFLRRTAESRRYLWPNAGAGAIWSSVLDVPAVVLLAIAPGRIPFC